MSRCATPSVSFGLHRSKEHKTENILNFIPLTAAAILVPLSLLEYFTPSIAARYLMHLLRKMLLRVVWHHFFLFLWEHPFDSFPGQRMQELLPVPKAQHPICSPGWAGNSICPKLEPWEILHPSSAPPPLGTAVCSEAGAGYSCLPWLRRKGRKQKG